MCLVKETDTHKLWRNIEPHLKRAMQTVYLREVSRSVGFLFILYIFYQFFFTLV